MVMMMVMMMMMDDDDDDDDDGDGDDVDDFDNDGGYDDSEHVSAPPSPDWASSLDQLHSEWAKAQLHLLQSGFIGDFEIYENFA